MKTIFSIFFLSLFTFIACRQEPDAWAKFTQCGSAACVGEAVAVKDAFLTNPKAVLGQFNATYEKGEDHVIGWLYLLRDSVLLQDKYGSIETRMAMQQAIVAAAKPYENDPKLGEMAKSVIQEIEHLAIAAEAEDAPEEEEAYLALTGTYAYELPGEGGSGELRVSMAGAESIRFSLSVVAGPPAHNQGSMEGVAKLTGVNTYEYQTSEYGGVCRLQFVFGRETLDIKTLEGDDASCGFGHNVRADGTYTQESHDDPFLSGADARMAKAITGQWVSTDDPKTSLRIENGMYTESYDGKVATQASYQFFPKCPADCNPVAPTPCLSVIGQDIVCYTVVKANAQTLELSMIGGRGNTLAFKRR
ncbi:MAG: hypothetical protein JNL02_07995 [Saprospiraceae bacterium]|nr:hypothetical protein [Saprospiraceae bacterium]